MTRKPRDLTSDDRPFKIASCDDDFNTDPHLVVIQLNPYYIWHNLDTKNVRELHDWLGRWLAWRDKQETTP